MSDKAKGRVWEMELPHGQMWVLHAMADHSDHLGRNIYAGHALIAWKTGYDVDTVVRLVRELVERGVLVLEIPGRRPSKNNRYHIDWAACPWKAAYEEPKRGRPKGQIKRTDILTVNYQERTDTMPVDYSPPEIKEPTFSKKEPTFGQKRTDILTRGSRTEPLKNLLTDSTLESTEKAKKFENGFTGDGLDGSAPPGAARPPSSPGAPARSEYILAVVQDYSRELGDLEHVTENGSQALRLWEGSGLPEVAFGELLHEARKRTRKHQTRPPGDPLRNKMAYFFVVLRDLLAGGSDTSEEAYEPAHLPPGDWGEEHVRGPAGSGSEAGRAGASAWWERRHGKGPP